MAARREARPALHAAPFHERRSFFAWYIAASALVEQGLRAVVGVRHGDPDAHADARPRAEEVERALERRTHAIRDPGEASSTAFRSSHSTVNSSPPSRATVSAGRTALRIPLGGLAQQLVARRVPEVVVDALEAVEIDEQDGDALARLARALDGVREPVGEEDAVGEAEERVAQRQLREPLGGAACSLMSWICDTK